MREGRALRIAGVPRGPRVTFAFEGVPVEACRGESLAAALAAAGLRATRTSAILGETRGYYCGMGVCGECVVVIEGRGQVRGCRVAVEEGMVVRALDPDRSAAVEPVA